MKKHVMAAVLITCSLAGHAEARKKQATWVAKQATDPITGASSCTVTASDRAAGMRFTRTGATYPVVELNSEHGLLVGVSSGGRYAPIADAQRMITAARKQTSSRRHGVWRIQLPAGHRAPTPLRNNGRCSPPSG
jgi:hypothetical protein